MTIKMLNKEGTAVQSFEVTDGLVFEINGPFMPRMTLPFPKTKSVLCIPCVLFHW